MADGFTFKVDVIGGKEVVVRWNRLAGEFRTEFRKKLKEIGDEIDADASSRVPVRTGKLKSSIKVRIGKTRGRRFVEDPGGLAMKVWPNSRVSHLIERGVKEQEIDVHKKAYEQKLWKNKQGRFSHIRKLRVRNAETLMYRRRHHIDPDPFFIPAVDRAGDISARLQKVINDLVGETK